MSVVKTQDASSYDSVEVIKPLYSGVYTDLAGVSDLLSGAGDVTKMLVTHGT